MNKHIEQASLEELVDIRYCDDEASLTDKIHAETEIIRRQRAERDFLACRVQAHEIGD
ncbi:hypothetical protein [Paenibacillus glycanilyticus]|uniref:hypothetical protein n=1 Tax=Paenibacillus glycanilyticus TaxID=126569 RepID=UPI0013E3FAC8|nr:hypothetical protein [Paenibacillus glycanilyticus]